MISEYVDEAFEELGRMGPCAEAGIRRLATSNDGENAGMSKINGELGFTPLETWSTYVLWV